MAAEKEELPEFVILSVPVENKPLVCLQASVNVLTNCSSIKDKHAAFS